MLLSPVDQRALIAVDLGAESCRVSLLRWVDREAVITLVHRFANAPREVDGELRWDLTMIEAGLDDGLRKCAEIASEGVRSIAVDGWAVDYVRVDKDGRALADPFCYRDQRTLDAELSLHRKISPRRLRELTGIQLMRINTLYQLHADALQKQPSELQWLNLPEYILSRLGSARVAEYTNATHTQMLELDRRQWCREIFQAADLDLACAPHLVPPGTEVGRLTGPLAELPAFRDTLLIAPACHDTASAIAGIPAPTEDSAYISSGTWSLMGVEMGKACLSPRVLELNMTNEGGFGGTYRLLKNIMGLWLVQQCKRSFDARGGQNSYDELDRASAKAKPFRSLLNVNRPQFYNPPDMPRAMQDFCRETGQFVPKMKGELIRCAYESLALQYRQTLGWLEELTGKRIEVIHIVGGGSQNRLLNQFTADACQRLVLAGPVEATVMGNLLVQAWAAGEIGSLSEMREVSRCSSSITTYEPTDSDLWTEAANRFVQLQKETE